MTSSFILENQVEKLGLRSAELESADNALLQLEVLQLIKREDKTHFKCDFQFNDFPLYREDPTDWEDERIPCSVILRFVNDRGDLFVPMGNGAAPQVRAGTVLDLYAYRPENGGFQQHIQAIRTFERWDVLVCEKAVRGGRRLRADPNYPNVGQGELDSALTSLAAVAQFVKR